MEFRLGIAAVFQTLVFIVSAQTSSVYTSASNNYFDGNRDNYATYGSAGASNKGAYVGNLNNNVFRNDKSRAFTGDGAGYNAGFNKNAQGRDNSYISNSGVKNNAYSGGVGDGKYFSSSTSNNKNNNGAFSRDDAVTTSTSTTNGNDGTISKSYSGNLNDVKEAFGGVGLYKDGRDGIQAAVDNFGSGSLGGIVGPKAFDYSRQNRPRIDAYAPNSGAAFENKLQAGYVDSFLNPQVSNQGRGFGGYNQFKEGRVFRPVQVRESNRASGSSNVKRPYAPVITNSYTPPTTYSGLEDPEVDSFFQVTNPLSNKQAVISGYRPSNNFVDPSHFIIPKEDKYEMVDQLFGGGLSQFGKSEDSGIPAQPVKSFIGTSKYSSVDEGLKNLGRNYYSDNNQKSNFNLGFFNDDKDKYEPGKQFVTASNNPSKASVQSFTDTGGNQASYRSGQGFQNQKGFSDQGRQNFDNSYDLKSNTGNIATVNRNQGQNAESSVAHQPQQGIPYVANKNPVILRAPKPTDLVQNAPPPFNAIKQSGYPQGPVPYGQPTAGKLLARQPTPDLFNNRQPARFNSVPQSSLSGSQYQGSSLFDKRQDLTPTPLFTGFSPNKRITVNEFKNKNLLGDENFGQTDYDRRRPTSASILGSDLYRQTNFGNQNNFGTGQRLQHQPYNQALQTNALPVAPEPAPAPAFTKQTNTFSGVPNQVAAFDNGGNGYNLVSGKTQTIGNSYDDGQSLSRGYTNNFDNSNSKSVGDQDKGGFATYAEKGSAFNGKENLNLTLL